MHCGQRYHVPDEMLKRVNTLDCIIETPDRCSQLKLEQLREEVQYMWDETQIYNSFQF